MDQLSSVVPPNSKLCPRSIGLLILGQPNLWENNILGAEEILRNSNIREGIKPEYIYISANQQAFYIIYSTQTTCKTKCSYVSLVSKLYSWASITLFSNVFGYIFTNYVFQLHWELTVTAVV